MVAENYLKRIMLLYFMANEQVSSYTFSPRVGDFYDSREPTLWGVLELTALTRTESGAVYAALQRGGRTEHISVGKLLETDLRGTLVYQRIGPDKKEPQSLADLVVPGDKIKTILDDSDPLWMTYVGEGPVALGDAPEFSFAVRHSNRKDYHVLASRAPQVVNGTFRYSSSEFGIVSMGTEEHARIMKLRGDYHATLVVYGDSVGVLAGGGYGDRSFPFTGKALYIPSEQIFVIHDPADPLMVSGPTPHMYGVVIGEDAEKKFTTLTAKPKGFAAMSLDGKGTQTHDILVGEDMVTWARAIYAGRNPSFEVDSLLRTSTPIGDLFSAAGLHVVRVGL